MLLNLGLGMGGLIGAAIVDIDRPETFVLLYLADAATYLFAWVTVASLRGRGGRPAHRTDPGADDATVTMHRQGWTTVLRDARLRRQVAVSLLLLTCGYGSLEAGLAIFITDTAQLPERIIGIVWLANTITIVIGQLLVLRMLQGRSRTRVIGVVGLLWGASWLMLSVVPGVPVAPAIAILMVSTVVFALGETLWSPTAPALVNAIAPDHLRGRYNAAQSLTWSLGASLAPVLSGLLIGAGRGVVWAVIVGLGCIGAAVFAQTLRPMLTPAEDGREPAAAPS
jgi:Na+/melibiose symporter-like transporter